MDVTFLPHRLTARAFYSNMQDCARHPTRELFRCFKTTTSESLIGQRVDPIEHVCDDVDGRRGPQRDLAHMEANGIDC